MKKVNHLESGDKIYILDGDESVEVTLTEEHISDRSKIDPAFVYQKLRLASTAVENDQVKLEKGYFYDNSVGMSVDYGYYFDDSDVKAFVSKEALEYYRDVYRANRIKLVTEDFEKMKAVIDEHISYIGNAIETHLSVIRRNQITDEDRESLDYRYVEGLFEAIYGEPMF